MSSSRSSPGPIPAARSGNNRAFLVRGSKGEYTSVFQLDRTRRMGIGRASSNAIVIADDGCSRNHAEVYFVDQRWQIQDLGSLNGTRVNDALIQSAATLAPGDRVAIGQAELVYVEDLSTLKPKGGASAPAARSDAGADSAAAATAPAKKSFSIVHRQDQTQWIQQIVPPEVARSRASRDLQTLYRLALRMGTAADTADLATVVLDGLLEATGAESGCILRVEDGMELTVLGSRSPPNQEFIPPPEGILSLVCADVEAILAQDDLGPEDTVSAVIKRTMICAPALHQDEVVAVLYLSSNPHASLTSEDLDLTVAVAQQFGSILLAIEQRMNLSTENEQLRETLRVETELVGASPAITGVLDRVGMAAPTDVTVLIRGESGVGKELVARAIHYSSRRREGPFVCLNCAALPETLLESELFGHEKGAFTGATELKKGKFEVAHKGTIFLDEIGEMSQATQSKFLRVLEGHAFERIGGDKAIRAQVRVVAATNRDLEKAVAEGKFRNDLYYRLQVVELFVPPLRERKGDIPLLAKHFLHRFSDEMGRRIRGFAPEALEKLTQYHWPGNVRELKNVIERTVVLTRNPVIGVDDIGLTSPAAATLPKSAIPQPPAEPGSLDDMEAEHIRRTLAFTSWNKSQAASILGIERSTLDRKIKRYAIAEPE